MFIRSNVSKLAIQCKTGVFFLILVGIPSSLTLFVKNKGVGEGVTQWTKSVKRDESYLSMVHYRQTNNTLQFQYF